MSELRDTYTKLGYRIEQIENRPRYLSELALYASEEIDNHVSQGKTEFDHVRELAEILTKYQLRTDNFVKAPDFPYMQLWRAMKDGDVKGVYEVSDLALEMNLLRLDLKNLPSDEGRLRALGFFLCDLSRELMTPS